MAFEAKLVLGARLSSPEEFAVLDSKQKQVYDLVECEYEFFQSLDESGKPSSRTQAGTIKFVMPAQGDDDMTFYDWMFKRAEKKNGTIEFILSSDDNKKKYLHLYFEEAYLVNFYQYFSNTNNLLVRTKITLSVKKMTFGNGKSSFINDWKLE